MESDANKAINGKTKISFLIKANPLVIETLAGFNPHFNKLKNPVLRKLLAPRVTIAEACKIGGCSLDDFLDKMAGIGFVIGSPDVAAAPGTPVATDVSVFKQAETTELDVRPMLARQQDPLKHIIEEANRLKPGACLKVINSFEPVPLISMLAKKGFRHYVERPEAEVVVTYFIQASDDKQTIEPLPDVIQGHDNAGFERMLKSFDPAGIRTIDVRELEMPLPMVNILEQLQSIAPGEALFVYHKKVPVFLLPELKERGFEFLIQDTADNKVNLLIFRP
jgi:uncharacterized protein (DUF2249 family)